MQLQYFVPVQIYFGSRCVEANADVFQSFGKTALIVTGKSSAKNGALQDVCSVLEKKKIRYGIFDAIEQNPSLRCVEEGGKRARAERADFLIAIGGGSPMDAAKGIAVLARQDVAPGGLFTHAITGDVLPMIHIPTTAGTGSEVTPYAIFTNETEQTKKSVSSPSLFPKAAFLDARYTQDLPRDITVNTAVDALSHSVEGMFSVRSNALTDLLAEESLRILMPETEKLASGMISFASREKLLYGSMLAGMVIANTGTSPVHTMGYSLTYFDKEPHGRANGLLLPAFLKACEKKDRALTEKVLRALGMTQTEISERLFALLGCGKAYSDETLMKYAQIAAKGKSIRNCRVQFTQAELYAILRGSFERGAQ